MSKKEYDWVNGAELLDHTKRKHKILQEYLRDYMMVRCSSPFPERFRLAIVDGFCGGARYGCGSPGSPIIFVETVKAATSELNIRRAAQGLKPIEVDLLLVVNDLDTEVINLCKSNLAPVIAAVRDQERRLSVTVEDFNGEFEEIYPQIKEVIARHGFKGSVIFNLDQCGHSYVGAPTIVDILGSYPSPEIFYTFAIQALLAYLQANNRSRLERSFAPFDIDPGAVSDLDALAAVANKGTWLGAAERVVFETFKRYGGYVSPFSINNPGGYQYWLIHFAKSYRAREVYNVVMHNNSTSQAHFGRSGLQMLHFDPRHEGSLYLFRDEDRTKAREQLYDDIPRAIANRGDAVEVSDFYAGIFNETPSHSDDIRQAIIDNPDMMVITPGGGERRVANTISQGDVIKIREQRSFHSIWYPDGTPPGKKLDE